MICCTAKICLFIELLKSKLDHLPLTNYGNQNIYKELEDGDRVSIFCASEINEISADGIY